MASYNDWQSQFNWDAYAPTIANIESGGQKDPYAIYGGANNHYVGKYQMGDAAIKDAARVAGLENVPTREELRQNPQLQEDLFKAYTYANHGYMMEDPRYAEANPMEQAAMLGYSHNQGAGGTKQWLETGISGEDDFGTQGLKYYNAVQDAWGTPAPQPAPTPNPAPSSAAGDIWGDVNPALSRYLTSRMLGYNEGTTEVPPMGYNEGTPRITATNRMIFNVNEQGDLVPTDRSLHDPTSQYVPKVAPFVPPTPSDPYAGVKEAIAGGETDYNKLFRQYNDVATANQRLEEEALRQYLDKNPQFTFPGGSQGVIENIVPQYNQGTSRVPSLNSVMDSGIANSTPSSPQFGQTSSGSSRSINHGSYQGYPSGGGGGVPSMGSAPQMYSSAPSTGYSNSFTGVNDLSDGPHTQTTWAASHGDTYTPNTAANYDRVQYFNKGTSSVPHMNNGGWLNRLFGGDDGAARVEHALSRRPGSRALDILPDAIATVPTASPIQPSVPMPTAQPSVPGGDAPINLGQPNNPFSQMSIMAAGDQPAIAPVPETSVIPPEAGPQVEMAPRDSLAQQAALLREQAKQLPRGSQERIDMMNRANSLEWQRASLPVQPAAPSVPEVDATPVPVAYAGRGQVVSPTTGPPHLYKTVDDLKHLSEEQIGELYDAGNEAAIKYAETEEDIWRTKDELNRALLQESVAAADAPGKPVISKHVDQLQENLNKLQDTPAGAMVEEKGMEMPVLPDAKTNAPGPGAWAVAQMPEELKGESFGAVPGIDAPSMPAGQDPRGEGTADQKWNQLGKPAATPEEAAEADIPKEVVDATENITIDGDTGGMKDANGNTIATASEVNFMKGAMMDLLGIDPKDVESDSQMKRALAQAAIVAAGGMLTGGSFNGSLAFASKFALQQGQARSTANMEKKKARATHINTLVKDGKYTTASIKKYKDSGDPSALVPVSGFGGPLQEMGEQKTYYDNNGAATQARKVKVGDNTFWVDKNNQPINLNSVHTDASRAPGTPEYRARVVDEAKNNTAIFEELQTRFGKFSTDEGDKFSTDLTPSKVGTNSAKWAIANDVGPEAMGQLIDNAYQAAMADSKDGKKVRNLEPYLNEQFVQAKVGDVTLFQDAEGNAASPAKFNSVMSPIINALRNTSEEHRGLSDSTLMTTVMQAGRAEWTALSDDERKGYINRAGPGLSGFMQYLIEDGLKR